MTGRACRDGGYISPGVRTDVRRVVALAAACGVPAGVTRAGRVRVVRSVDQYDQMEEL